MERHKTPLNSDAARDQQVRDEHSAACARGEKRYLSRTVNGELYSYASDEFGVIGGPTRGKQVRTLTGLIVVMSVGWLLVLGTLVEIFVYAPFVNPGDGRPAWPVLVVTGITGIIAWVGTHYVAEELRARKVRKARGVPEPRAGSTS